MSSGLDTQHKENFLSVEDKVDNEGDVKEEIKQENPDLDEKPIHRNYWQRTFGPMADGSLRSSIFTLANLTMGTGCLALPQVLYRLGFVQGCLTIILMAMVSYVALYSLSSMSQKYDIYEYSLLLEKILGKGYSLLGDVFILLYLFMCLVSYLVISKDINL